MKEIERKGEEEEKNIKEMLRIDTEEMTNDSCWKNEQ
jgi:hypothetical protein